MARTVDLPIDGMTCGACAARIERGLSRLEGVATASVNLAAERATVTYDPEVTGPPAFADKVAAIPLAATGRLHPMVAAAAMSLSSVFVVACSLQLRSFSPARPSVTRLRRLGLAALAVVALAAALALSPRLADPPAMPATPAAHTTVYLERP